MNKKLAVPAIGVAVLVAAWAGGSWVTGQRVQAALLAQAEGLKTPAGQAPRAFRVTEVKYDRGLLGATRTLTVAFGCEAAPAVLTWRDDIRHGPLPGFAGFGAARIDSALVLSAEQREKLKSVLGDAQAQLQLRTLVAYNGSYKTQLDVPALRMKSAEGGEFEIQGASAWVQVAVDGSARYEASLPNYALSAPGAGQGPGVRVSLSGAKMQGEGLAPLWWAFSGKGAGSLAAMSVETFTPDGQRQPFFSLKNLSYTQDGGISAGLYQASGSMQGQGQMGSMVLDAMAMKVSMKQLHADSYAALMAAMINTACPGSDATADPMAALKPMLAPMQALLPHGPQIGMDELSMTLGGLTAKMNYQLGVNGITAEEVRSEAALMPVLMQKAVLSMGVEAPEALLAKLAEAMGKPLPPEMLEQQLAQAAAQGMLVRSGATVSAKFELRNGTAQLNGKPMPMPGMSGVPGQAPAPTPAAPPTPPTAKP